MECTTSERKEKKRNMIAMVMGDVERSPRMMRHVQAAKERGWNAMLLGQLGSDRIDGSDVRTFSNPPSFDTYPRWMSILLRQILIFWNLIKLMWNLKEEKTDSILVQAPPAFPAILLCWIYARWLNARLVVDWHNYGDTILSMDLGKKHPMVRLCRFGDRIVSILADDHLCVSECMREDLRFRFGVEAHVVHDRPHAKIHRPKGMEKENLIQKTLGRRMHRLWKDRRLALVITSTSWTADEDFDVLLDAMTLYERAVEDLNVKRVGNGRTAMCTPKDREDEKGYVTNPPGKTKDRSGDVAGERSMKNGTEEEKPDGVTLPDVLLVITGKGPRRSMYERKILDLNLSHVIMTTVWVEVEDYPRLLAAADLGVSLHASSSGVDLPMKVVDMFAAGLPVLASRYSCIEKELIQVGNNGLLFEGANELCAQLQRALIGLPDNNALYSRIRQGAEEEYGLRNWQQEWSEMAEPAIAGRTD